MLTIESRVSLIVIFMLTIVSNLKYLREREMAGTFNYDHPVLLAICNYLIIFRLIVNLNILNYFT